MTTPAVGRSVPAIAGTGSGGGAERDVTTLLDAGRREQTEGGAQAVAGADTIGESAPETTEAQPPSDAGAEAPTLEHLVGDVRREHAPDDDEAAIVVDEATPEGGVDGAPEAPPADPLKPLPEGDALADPVLDERIARAEESATAAEAAADALEDAHERLEDARRDGNIRGASDIEDEIADLEQVAQLAIEEARANREIAERYAQVTYGIDLGELADRRGFAEDLRFHEVERRIENAQERIDELSPSQVPPSQGPTPPPPPTGPDQRPRPEWPIQPSPEPIPWPSAPGGDGWIELLDASETVAS